MAKRAKAATRSRSTGRGNGGNGKAAAVKQAKSRSDASTKRAMNDSAAPSIPAAPLAASDLPLGQVQAMLRLVGETAELWYDPKLQRKYMLESLCRLLHARAGACFSFGDLLTGGAQPPGPMVDSGFEEAQFQAVRSYLSTGQPIDP